MSSNVHDRQGPPIVCILGPTASGKTRLAVHLAKTLSGEVVSVDSRQVYRGMDIGTGKDLDEYQDIPYHLIDVCSPSDEYNLFNYVSGFNEVMRDLQQRSQVAILAGGTGMYLDAILNRYELTKASSNPYTDLSFEEVLERLKQLNPSLHNTTDLTDRARAVQALNIVEARQTNSAILQARYGESLIIGLRTSRETIKARITERLKSRLQAGMIEEVESLHQAGIGWDKLHFFGLEYRYVAEFLQGKLNYNDMFQKLNSAIHKFAKQQEKWFRNIENKGITINWLELDSNFLEQAEQLSRTFLVRS